MRVMRDSFLLLILWWCCFLFLVFRCECTEVGCFQYVLENECTTVVGNVSIEEKEQQHFFDERVSLIVSDVRMQPDDCRRPFLSFYCQLMFGTFSCESSSLEEQHCLEEQYCLQVADACSGHFEFNCSSFLTSSSSSSPYNCTEEVTEQIEEVEKKPIQVQTCLNSSKEEIRCCFDPFVFDDNDECVVGCPQYIFGEQLEKGVRLFTYSLTAITFLVYITAVTPLFVMKNMKYPNCPLFMAYAAYFVSFIPNGGVLIFGPTNFVCKGEKSYWNALEMYGRSTGNLIEFSLWTLFVHISFSQFSLFCFNLFCLSMRNYTSFFDKFIKQPVNPTIVILMEGPGIFISVVIMITTIIYGELSDSVLVAPAPNFLFPWAVESVVKQLFQIPVLIWSGLSAIFLLSATFLFIKRGRHILYYQWRTIVIAVFWLIVFTFEVVLLYEMEPNYDTLNQYVNCVSVHPQNTSSPCQREYANGILLFFSITIILALFLCLLIVAFWSNPLVILWWKEAIFSRNIMTPPKNEKVNDPERWDSERQQLLQKL